MSDDADGDGSPPCAGNTVTLLAMLAGPRPTVVAATMAVVGVTALALAQLVAVVAGPAGDGPGGSGGVGVGPGVARDVDVYARQGARGGRHRFLSPPPA